MILAFGLWYVGFLNALVFACYYDWFTCYSLWFGFVVVGGYCCLLFVIWLLFSVLLNVWLFGLVA